MGGSGSVKLDVGSLAIYLEDRFLRIFGKDPENRVWNEKLKRRWQIAGEQARFIQCIGMDRPIPIEEIYQPVRLYRGNSEWQRSKTANALTIEELLRSADDAIILAGPGRGKSTLLNWLFVRLLKDEETSAIMFLLRSENACEDLISLVEKLVAGKRPKVARGETIVLLVDGYDEISEEQRKQVSAALNQFKSAALGRFLLTCRTFYDVYELKVPHFTLGELRDEDAVNFVAAFARFYEHGIDATLLVHELKARKLAEFARHPLLLTLTCILKTGARPDLPNNAIALLRRAFDTLTFRWDEQKGIARQSTLPLDGDDRIACTMHIAFHMGGLQAKTEVLEKLVRNFLLLTQGRDADPRRLLLEIARWYGVLVQVDEQNWQFAHRCIHDYLAARYMVENGKFNPHTVKTWNSKTAYAACITYDATEAMVQALAKCQDLQAFTECLYNRARFYPKKVALSVVEHFRQHRGFLVVRLGNRLTAQTDQDFFHLAPNSFLQEMTHASLESRPIVSNSPGPNQADPHDLVCAYSLASIHRKQKKIINPNTLQLALDVYGSGDYIFQIGVEVASRYEFRFADVVAKELKGMLSQKKR